MSGGFRSGSAWSQRHGAAPARVGRRASPPTGADTAEVVVQRGPAPDGEARSLQACDRVLVDARLDVDDAVRQVRTWAVDRLLRVEPLVEDAGRDADERGAEARATGRADREREAVAVECEARR